MDGEGFIFGTVVKGFEKEEQECVDALLADVPEEGGCVSRHIFEQVVRGAFQGGLAAATRKLIP